MRILQVINSIAPSRGGPTYVVTRLSRALTDLGAEVHVLSTRADLDAAGEAEVRRQLGSVTLTLVPTVGSARLELSPRWLLALGSAARQCDAAHIHTVFTYPVAVAPPVLRALNVPHLIRPAGTLDPTCIALRSTRSKQLAIAGYVRHSLQRAARVHVTSAVEESAIRELAPRARTALVELGVDVAPALDEPSGPLRIGSLGRIHPIKRLEVLVQALALLPGVELALAGSGAPDYIESLRTLARASGVAERVRFLGHLDANDKLRFLAGCTLMAFPSLHESFGVAVAESMAAGRAVVVSPEVGISGIIAARSAGVVTAARAPEFAAAIERLLRDRSERARTVEAGRALALEAWSWPEVARRTLEIYGQIAA
jgi:glycosyltransferase involved in cell wall biosynthesis